MRLILLLWTSLLLAAEGPVGSYVGELQIPTGKLRIGLTLQSAGGSYSAELISLDQGMAKLPLSSLTVDGKSIRLEASAARLTFAGVFSEDFQTITGKLSQGLTFDLVLHRVAELPKPARPQEPRPPFPYVNENFRASGGAKDITLAGTLSFPRGAAKLPAIVLVSGSGPQNRDEEIAGHKPFLVWADALVRAGYVVVRYDDRGVNESTGTFKGATTADFAADARAMVEFLRTRAEADPSRIFVLGHSEGGLIAPMVANADGKLAGIILLAAPGVSGEAVLRRQIPDLVKAAGAPESIASNQLAMIEKQAESDPWMKYFWSYDPAPALQKVKCPVLSIHGELDHQVHADTNLTTITAALEAGGNQRVTAKKLPRLNHLLQTANTGAGTEYAQIEETLAVVAIQEVTGWLKQVLATK